MSLKGKFDTVIVKEKTRTSDGRGGVTTALTVKIAALVGSLQPMRREEMRVDAEGQEITDPAIFMYDTPTSGPDIVKDNVIVHSTGDYLVVTVNSSRGIGAHSEAVLKKVTNDAHLA